MRVAVIGGGVMGCATALALARRGAEVVVLERAVPGAEASSAAAGILGAQVESHGQGDHLMGFVDARNRYPAWAEELRSETGIDIGYRACGVLRVAWTGAEDEALAKDVAWQAKEGLRAELLSARDARKVEPELSESIRSAAHFPDDAQVDPPMLLRALVAAAARAKVTIRSGTTVVRLLLSADRCTGVVLEDGELAADATVLAAGSWSSLVPGGAEVVKVRPARGQMVLLEERPPRVRTIVFGPGAYVVPRGDGRILCGSTTEFVGFRREVTAGGVHGILAGALQSVPSLAGAELSATWSSFRPYAEKLVLGASAVPGLFLATGHYRNGILLAKYTADVVAEAVIRA